MLQSIELFSGSALLSQLLAEKGFATFTVDYESKFHPDLCIDIVNLLPQYLPGTVHFFWASPDCRYFSRAASQKNWQKETMSYRNYKYTPVSLAAAKSIELVKITVDLILYFKPFCWFLENPVGRLPYIDSIRNLGHYRYCVNYSDWGHPYAKETYIFTNQLLPLPTKVQKRSLPGLRSLKDASKRSEIPAKLLQFLINHSNLKNDIL